MKKKKKKIKKKLGKFETLKSILLKLKNEYKIIHIHWCNYIYFLNKHFLNVQVWKTLDSTATIR